MGAVLLFGTGFGGLVTGLTVAIASFIPKMLGAIKLLKASKLGGKAGLLKGGLLLGGGILAGMGISKMMDKGEDVSKQKVQGLADGGVAGGSSYDQIMRETTVDTFETKEKGVVTGSGKSISVRNATGMCGNHHMKRKTYGYSLLADPWGKIVNSSKNPFMSIW